MHAGARDDQHATTESSRGTQSFSMDAASVRIGDIMRLRTEEIPLSSVRDKLQRSMQLLRADVLGVTFSN